MKHLVLQTFHLNAVDVTNQLPQQTLFTYTYNLFTYMYSTIHYLGGYLHVIHANSWLTLLLYTHIHIIYKVLYGTHTVTQINQFMCGS